MITIYKIENTKIQQDDDIVLAELRGLSTDEKPTEIGERIIGNGSAFIEIDTQKIYFYDGESQEWIGA